MHLLKQFIAVVMIVLLSACATLSPNYEKPQVSITSFSLNPESKGIPSFNIGLRVINPNSAALPIEGMSYSVEIEGNRVLTGAEPNLPKIEGYGTADVVIQATPDLLGGIKLIQQLVSTKSDSLNYLFKAKLDVGTLMPFVNIEEKGSFDINNLSK